MTLWQPSVHIDQSITHFENGFSGQDYFWSPMRFYEKYASEISKKNPVILGYLFHLWLDVNVMTFFMSRVPFSDVINNGSEVNKWKRNDLNVYIHEYPQQLGIENVAAVVEASKRIEEISISEKDLLQVPCKVDNSVTDMIDGKYHIFDEKTLDEFYERICKDFVNWC